MKKRTVYGLIFLLLLGAEICIAEFVHDSFVRPYIGDVLVMPLLCCLVRIFFPDRPERLPLYMCLTGVTAELLQASGLSRVPLIAESRVLSIALGSTFDPADILCYATGCLLFYAAERLSANK